MSSNGKSIVDLKRPSSDSMIDARPTKIWLCSICNKEVQANHITSHCNSNEHKTKALRVDDDCIEIIETAFKNRIISFRFMAHDNESLSYSQFLSNKQKLMVDQIKKILHDCNSIKINLQTFGLYILPKKDAKEEVKSFNTRNQVVSNATDLNELLRQFFDKIGQKTQEFCERESGWTLVKVLFVELNINKYEPLRCGSYIKLPRSIRHKHACINVKNYDDKCFAWAVISALYPASAHTDRVSAYPKPEQTSLNFEGLSFPVRTCDLEIFENNNNISINVYGLNEDHDDVFIERLTTQLKDKHINLLYLQDGERSHFCWIKNLPRLIRSPFTKRANPHEICDGCLLFFHSKVALEEHRKHGCRHLFLTEKGENIKI